MQLINGLIEYIFYMFINPPFRLCVLHDGGHDGGRTLVVVVVLSLRELGRSMPSDAQANTSTREPKNNIFAEL